jgi:hypothetical protein
VSLVRKATPVLVVDRIEPALPFWKKVGLTPTTEIPDGAAGDGRLAFVILAAGSVEIMYQTAASVRDDMVESASIKDAFRATPQQTLLFVEVAKLSEVEARLQGELVVMPRRQTFYGSTEVGYADTCGNIVVFAEHHA